MTERAGGFRADSGADLKPPDNDGTLDELRSLLMGRHQQELLELRERLDNRKIRAQDVSEVLVEALRLRESADKNHQLSEVLLPTVERTLTQSVRKDAAILAEALYPVMGPAIRTAVYESIRALIQSFDVVLTQTLSMRGLKWRFEAMRTGRPFAEVVLLHSLVFRVEQVYLIHKKSGLLLVHLAMPSLQVQDPDIVAGQLRAIGQVVSDSFNAEKGTSVGAIVGDFQIFAEQGPRAVLSIVIRGRAPQRLRDRLKELLEEVHQKFGDELESFQGETDPFLPATEILEKCFETQLADEEPFRSRPVWVAATLVLILGLGWVATSIAQRGKWNRFVEGLRHEPGVVVTSYDKRGGRFYIQGLRDPLSIDPADIALKTGLDPRQVVFEWKGYGSQEDPLVLKRAVAFLKPPDGVSVSIRNGTLIVKGECDDGWASRLGTLGPLISGVRGLDTAGLSNLGPLGKEKEALETEMILFPTGQDEIPDDQGTKVGEAAEAIRHLLAKAREVQYPVVVQVTGHVDSTGTEIANIMLSWKRAQNVSQALMRLGVPAHALQIRGVSSSEPVRQETTESERRYNRRVSFLVVSPDSTPKH